jgi:hypothetical protein
MGASLQQSSSIEPPQTSPVTVSLSSTPTTHNTSDLSDRRRPPIPPPPHPDASRAEVQHFLRQYMLHHWTEETAATILAAKFSQGAEILYMTDEKDLMNLYGSGLGRGLYDYLQRGRYGVACSLYGSYTLHDSYLQNVSTTFLCFVCNTERTIHACNTQLLRKIVQSAVLNLLQNFQLFHKYLSLWCWVELSRWSRLFATSFVRKQ